MHFTSLLALAGLAAAQHKGFNYGASMNDGTVRVLQDFENEFNRAKNLAGQSGFTSARLYTMVQGGTANTVSSAIQAAINTQTTLLLGLWGSAGQAAFSNEITALSNAISQYGTSFTDLITGISVGSEDLYRVSPTGIENLSGYGASPDELVSYISQVRDTIRGTAASGATIGHVDTWTAWVNGSNAAVINAVDWLGMDGYPYYQTTQANGIANAESLFFDSYNATVAVSGGKDVWVTETGWPYQGPTAGDAVASVGNAETYWQEVACRLLGNVNTYWFTLHDPKPSTSDISFGVVGNDLNSAPLYNLACSNGNSQPSSSASSTAPSSTVAAPTMPTTAAASSPVSIVTTPNVESSPASIPVVSTSAAASEYSTTVSTSVVASAYSTAAIITSGTLPATQPMSTLYSTTLVTITSCNDGCPSSYATVSAPASPYSASAPSYSASAPSYSASASSYSAPASQSSALASASVPASPSGSSCPTNLNGQYEYPHLIVPVDSQNPDKAYGTSYNGTISSTISSIFNFDIPASYAGKTCSLIFLFPSQKDLTTSAYEFNGKGGIMVSELMAPATAQTTYDTMSAPGASQTIAEAQPGNEYLVTSHECGAGQRVAFEFSSVGGLELNYFQDYNPSPLGAYITVC